MDATSRLMASLQRHGPHCGIAGGLLFYALWSLQARDAGLPWAISTGLRTATFVLLAASLVGLQLAQGAHPRAWVGWGGIAAALDGIWTSAPLMCAGLVAFGWSIVLCQVHPRITGVMLAAGAGLLMVVQGYGVSLSSEHPTVMDGPWRLLLGLALLLVAGALADLGFDNKRQERHTTA